jgi:mono/diheme cytochrome c family protein
VQRRPLVVLAAALAACAAWGAVHAVSGNAAARTTTVAPFVAEGAHDFVQFACGQCHGPNGIGGVSSAVPALRVVGRAMSTTQLRSIINHGLGVSKDPAKPYMPVWGAVMSNRQVSALAAYLHAGLPAVEGAAPVSVQTTQGPVVEGQGLFVRYGCINCHGPNGLGGVPNPQSPDKSIPPLSGADFFKEFDTKAKIADVIRSGSVIGRAPIVSMPHWGGILKPSQINALVAYIQTLKSR